MGYPDSHGQHSFGGLKFWRNIKARARLQNHICTEATIKVNRVNEEENVRRKWCLGQKLGESFYLFSDCNFQHQPNIT